MAWVVDTCVLLDIAEDDRRHVSRSINALTRHLRDGLTVCPVSVIELAPRFGGDLMALRKFLAGCGVQNSEPWMEADTEKAAEIWTSYIQLKRAGKSDKRPMADILIGAFAERRSGLITRNPNDFTKVFPKLKIIEV